VDVHDIEQQPDNEELFHVLAELSPKTVAPQPSTPSSSKTLSSEVVAPLAPQARVVLYCTPWCPTCTRARAYLKERNIPFVEIDISRDRAAAQRVRGWANGFETTPTFDIEGTIIVSFDRAKMDKVLSDH
jgi:glutaredoxin 3